MEPTKQQTAEAALRRHPSETGPPANGAGKMSLDNRAMTRRTSLALPPSMPMDDWRNLGQQIFVISDSSGWWLGDWLVYGQSQYPDRYRTAVAETSLGYQTLRNYAWVARRFPVNRRRSTLSFQHHAEVASMGEEDQDTWLNRADKFRWSRNELRRRIRATQSIERATKGDQRVQVQVQVHAQTTQRARWEQAARNESKDLAEWIVGILDHAADGAITEGAEDE
ncbi:LmbU family transcriptional regulator [Nocardiopsis sp. NPDC007018]|uniref:LmbU family transcriptional regulator n=1 Tax=Nocardiopsis sp. NPDC007018 TaxID=3155721 RepID=UPI003405938C